MSGTAAVRKPKPLLLGLVVFLFFAWGFATVLLDTLVPKLKGVFSLSYSEVMLTQFSFFIGYLIFSIPAGFILSRIGYVRGAVFGLVVMASGCLLFIPATYVALFPAFLLALFVMAAGITLLQVVANPFIAELGSEASSHSRLTLAQAFNSLGTTIGPWVGAVLILRTGVSIPRHGLSPAAIAMARRAEAHSVELPFVGIAVALLALACAFWLLRGAQAPAVSPRMATFRAVWALRNRRRLLLGAMAIFLYVGAEVSIGSIMTNYLMQPTVLALKAEHAGKLVSLYWGGAMVGRFIGSFLLRQVKPGLLLAGCAICTTILAIMSSITSGELAAAAIIAVGLFNSIMFPTIFALGCENLGEETPNGSALLVMAIVGGAVVPLLTGAVADRAGLSGALLVPAVCYIGIIVYGALAATGFGLQDEGNPASI